VTAELQLHSDQSFQYTSQAYLTELNREFSNNLLCSVDKQIAAQRPRSNDIYLRYIIPGMLEYFDYDELM